MTPKTPDPGVSAQDRPRHSLAERGDENAEDNDNHHRCSNTDGQNGRTCCLAISLCGDKHSRAGDAEGNTSCGNHRQCCQHDPRDGPGIGDVGDPLLRGLVRKAGSGSSFPSEAEGAGTPSIRASVGAISATSTD